MALTKIPASLLDTSGGLDLQGNITLGDSEKILLGASSDLQIYHDESGGHSRIDDTGTGGLVIRGSQVLLEKYGGGYMMNAVADGASELYHAGSKKFETTSTGATVTGDLAVTGDLNITGNVNSASVTDLDVTDKTITLGAGQTEALSGGSGIIIDGSGASILWDETNDDWDFNAPLHITHGTPSIKFTDSSSSANYSMTLDGVTVNITNAGTNGSTAFHTHNGEKLRLGATNSYFSNSNVGIGTTSPLGLLSVGNHEATSASIGDVYISGDAVSFDSTFGRLFFRNSNRSGGSTASMRGERVSNNYGTALTFYTNSTSSAGNGNERMRIDSTGNIGIGTTPSAHSFSKAIEIGDGAVWSVGGNQNSTFASNAYLASNAQWKYIASRKASKINLYNGGFIVATTDTTGTAGNDITFTDRLTVLANGNVGIGIDNPSNALDVQTSAGKFSVEALGGGSVRLASNGSMGMNVAAGYSYEIDVGGSEVMRILSTGKVIINDNASHTDDLLQIETPASGGGHGIQIRRNDSNSDQGIGRIMFGNNTDTDLATIRAITDGSTDNARLVFSTQPSGGSSTDRMTIKESGNVGIGNDSPAETLHIGSGQSNYIRIHNAASGDVASGLSITRGNSTGLALYDNPFDDTTTFNAIGNINFRTNNTSHRLYIKDNGSVAIGGNATAGHSFEVQDRSDGYSMFWTGRSSSGEGRGLTNSYGLMGVNSTQYDGDGAAYPIAGIGAAADNSSHESVDFWFGNSVAEWQPMVIYAIGASTQTVLTGQAAGWACIRATHFNNGISASIVDSGGSGTFTVSVQGTYGADRTSTARVRVTYEISGNNRTVMSAWVASYGGLYGATRA